MRSTRDATCRVQSGNGDARLKAEFRRLRTKLGLSGNLQVLWAPRAHELSGEVKGNVVYIYECGVDNAIRALKHELIDYMITSKVVIPLVDLLNTLIKAREGEIYLQKEKIVDVLSGLI